MTPRWEHDDRGVGVATAGPAARAVRALLEAAGADGWVAEEPEHHVVPHIVTACGREGSPWTLTGWTVTDRALVVDLEHRRTQGEGAGRARTRDVFSLLGEIAETATSVRLPDVADGDGATSEVEVVTGVLDGDGPFAAHGHVLRLRIHEAC